MKKIVTTRSIAQLSKDLGVNYHYLRKCLMFQVQSMKASQTRAEVLSLTPSRIIEL